MATSNVVAFRSRIIRIVLSTTAVAIGLGVASARWLGVEPARATGNAISIAGHDQLGIGLQDVYHIVLSDPAPPGGLAVTIDSNDAACVLALTDSAVGDGAPITVTVPANRERQSFVVQTVPGASGSCDITATATGWTTGSLSLPVVQPRLRIRDLAGHIGPLAGDDPFFVEVGVPTANGSAVRYVQSRSEQFGDLLVTVCSDRPDLGTIVNVFGSDPPPVGCEDNPIHPPFSRTVPGDYQFDPIAGDDNVDIHVTATASDVLTDQRSVDVRTLSVTGRGHRALGAGLQDDYSLSVSSAPAADLAVTVSVDPSDTQYCVVAGSEQRLGQQSIATTVAAGRYRAEFVVQGVGVTPDDPAQPCVVTIDAGSYGIDTLAIDVVQPGLRLRELGSTFSQYAPDDPFFVDLGVPDVGGRSLRFVQAVRKGTDPTPNTALPVTVSSDHKEIGTIVNAVGVDVNDDGMETDNVLPAFARTVPGNLQFDPVMGSDTLVHVTATAPGFITTDAGEQDITVKAAGLALGGTDELGSWLQDDYTVALQDAGGHAATTVTLTSMTTDTCLVAPNASTDGSASLALLIDANHNSTDFVVDAAEMVADVDCLLHATAPGYEPADFHITIRQPGIQIRALQHNIDSTDGNDPFFVEVGVPNDTNTALRRVQALRKRPDNLSVMACSSDKTAGTIVDVTSVDNGNDGCESDVIFPTFSSNVPGDLQFDPLSPGSTIVTASADGFRTMERTGKVEVKVGGDSLRLGAPDAVGSGLQETGSVRLSRPAGSGGVTVTIASDTPSLCKVATDPNTASSDSVPVVIPEGERAGSFVVAALEGLDGVVCRVHATATGFIRDDDEADIVTPGLQIADLDSTTGTTAPDAAFTVQIGVPASPGRLRFTQAVRINGIAVPITACSSSPSVGAIVGAGADGCLTQSIQPGQDEVTFVFHVTGTVGVTKVSVSGGVGAMDTEVVHVAQTVVNLRCPNVLGKDLQGTCFAVANNNGGVALTLHADSPSTCVSALDPNTPGDGLDKPLTIPAGTTRAAFYVQALDVGACALRATAPTVPDATSNIPVVYARLRIRALAEAVSFKAPNDPFFVEIGPADPDVEEVLSNPDNRSGITLAQPRRAGAPLTVKVCSSDPTVALLYDPGHTPIGAPLTPQCVTADIAGGDSQTDDFEFDPLAPPSTDVSAAAPSEPDVGQTVETVTVNPGALNINGPSTIGKDLEDNFSVVFSAAPPNNTTVTLTASGGCVLAATSDQPGSGQLILPIPAGRSRNDFWVQAVALGTCTVSANTTASGFNSPPIDLDVVTPAVRIRGLDSSRSTMAPDDQFYVDIGVARSDLRNLAIEQIVRPDHATYPLPLTGGIKGVPLQVCTSAPPVGTVVGAPPDANACVHGVIEPLHSTIDAFKFHSVGTGSTYISVAEDGVPLIITTAAVIQVNVVPDTISINGPDTLGVDLQDDYRVVLSQAAAADGQAALTSQTPTICLVGPGPVGPFGATATVTISTNHTRADFSIQALTEGACVVSPSITLTGYVPVPATIRVVAPSAHLINLDTSRSTQSPDDPFNVEIGIARDDLRSLADAQDARVGSGGIAVTVCSSNPTVGAIVGGDSNGCKTVAIPEGQSRTPDGALAFDAIAAGSTTLCVSGSGFIPVGDSCKDVVVASVVVNVNGADALGAGLEDGYVLALSSSVAADTTFTISTSTPALCKLAATDTASGSDSITVTIPAGRSRADLFVMGMDGVMGACELSITTASAGISPGVAEIDIVMPALRIVNLDTSRSTHASDDPFNVALGVPQSSLKSLSAEQVARSGGGGVPVTVCSSMPAVGDIVGSSGACITLTIPEGDSRTPDGALAFHSVAAGTTVICAAAPGFITTDQGCADVVVSTISTNLNGPDALGSGLEDGYSLVLSSTVSSDTAFTVTSITPTVCSVAVGPTDAGSAAINLTVTKNHSRADFYVLAFENTQDTCTLTATTASGGIASGYRQIEVVRPALRIVNLDTSRSTQSADDPFNVEIGIPQSSLKSLSTVQMARIGGGGVPVSVCSSNPTVGTITGGSAGCKAATILEGGSRTTNGDLNFDAVAAGATTVCASSPGSITTDQGCKDIVVASIVPNLNGSDSLGASLEDQYTLALSSSVSADTVFTVASSDPSLCKISVNETDVGVTSISVTIPSGRSRATLYVHGMDDVTGTCELAITTAASGISAGTADIEIVTPALRIRNLGSSIKTGGTDDSLVVDTGIPSSSLKTLDQVQERRAGAALLTVTACSSNTLAATMVGTGSDPACRTATVAANSSQTGNTALAVHAVAAGSTTISATATGFISTAAAYKDVTVASGSITLSGPDTVGAGLQDTFAISINPSAATSAGVPITLISTTPAVCYVAKDESTAGAGTYSLTIAKGHSSAKFAIQGLEGADGLCHVSATTTDPNYAGDEFDVDVHQPGVRIRALDPTTTAVSSNDPFFVDVGVPRDNLNDLRLVQTVRAGAPALTVTACSSNTAVGVTIGTATANPACKSATIVAGSSATATNALQFDPLTAGSTTVTASAPGYITTEAGSVDVVVASAALSIVALATDQVGAGLMETFRVKASSAVGTATIVTVISNTPAICQVAVSESTAPASSVQLTINAGSSYVNFAIHGVENQADACQLRATATSFADGFGTFDVVQPALRISGLSSSKSPGSSDDGFFVDVGTPKSGLGNVQTLQKVRTGSAGQPMTVCSSDPTVGQIVTASGTATCGSVTIPAGADGTATNAFKFHVAGSGGTTTVQASAPNFIATDAATVDVTVSGFSLTIKNDTTDTVGAGLQQGTFYVQRQSTGISNSVAVTVTSLTPGLCVVSTAGTTAGGTSIGITIAANATTSPFFWVQGPDGVIGGCQLQATATGYTTGSGSTNIVTPAIRLSNLATSMLDSAANDPFNVDIGVPTSDQSNLSQVQQVRAGSAGVSITLSNSNSAVAQLVSSIGPSPAQTVMAQITPGNSTTTGTLQFDPLAAGGTSVTASTASAISTTAANVTVAVTSGSGC